MNSTEILNQLTQIVVAYGPKLVGAILVWIIGSWVVKALTRAFGNIMDKRDLDPSLKPFLRGLVNGLLKVMLVISVLGMLGIEMTSFIAIFGCRWPCRWDGPLRHLAEFCGWRDDPVIQALQSGRCHQCPRLHRFGQ
ncbi:MAG: hypothetical protein AAF399_07990 [Bacteroidota bacterium]